MSSTRRPKVLVARGNTEGQVLKPCRGRKTQALKPHPPSGKPRGMLYHEELCSSSFAFLLLLGPLLAPKQSHETGVITTFFLKGRLQVCASGLLCHVLRMLWSRHRHQRFFFPRALLSLGSETISGLKEIEPMCVLSHGLIPQEAAL